MKRALSLILAIVLCAAMLTGCCLFHEWVEADCENPKTCAKCEKTDGDALGHDWAEADCTNPKTCGRCGETEGEALGHDWADADCTNPKTCGRCGETEGEALGHSYSGWEAVGTDTMAGTCAVCGEKQEKPLDREFIGRQQLVGRWQLTSVTLNGMWYDLNLGWTLEFHEDGTFVLVTMEEDSGEIVFSEFYEGENMDLYVFDGKTAEHSYNFNYEPVADLVFIAGQEIYKFTRIVE